jgi:imidazoleglycerol-phosphate dehydratase/histidinol-phosphatase
MKRYLFIDRDGTLIREPADEQIDSLDKLEFMPGVFTWLGRIAAELDYGLVLVSNQDGLGTASFPEENFWPAHTLMLRALQSQGIAFEAEHIDRSFAHEGLPSRKPGTAMLEGYRAEGIDLGGSWVIGDRWTDVLLGRNLGSGAILLGQAPEGEGLSEREYAVADWPAIYTLLRERERRAVHRRKTAETEVELVLQPLGRGRASIKTGLGFFDHMLDQLARHGGLDLELETRGDLHIDEHHTVEDTGIALGEAFALALADKRGLARYGFSLPMDESRARAELDFGGRAYLRFSAQFRRERVGELPTELVEHFFRSFCDAARCTLHLHVEGENDHHQIEALFKAFARAMRMALRRDPDGELPTTKGML